MVGKLSIQTHATDRDTYHGASNFPEGVWDNGNRVLTTADESRLTNDGNAPSDTDVIDGRINTRVKDYARTSGRKIVAGDIDDNVIPDVSDFQDESEVDARIDRRIVDTDIPSTGTNNESTTNAPSRQTTKKYVDASVNTKSGYIAVTGSPKLVRVGDHVRNGTNLYLALVSEAVTTSTDFTDTTRYQPIGGGQDPRIPNSDTGSPFLVAGSGNNFQNSTELAVAARLRPNLVSNDRIADPASTTIAPTEDAVKAYVDANAGTPTATYTSVHSNTSVTSAVNTWADTGYNPATDDANTLYRIGLNTGRSTRNYTAADMREFAEASIGSTTATNAGTNVEILFSSNVNIPFAIDTNGNLLVATSDNATFTITIERVDNVALVESGATIRSKLGIEKYSEGTAGQVLKLNADRDGLEFADDNSGSSSGGGLNEGQVDARITTLVPAKFRDANTPTFNAGQIGNLANDRFNTRFTNNDLPDTGGSTHNVVSERAIVSALAEKASTADLPETTLSSLADSANSGAGPSEGDVVKWQVVNGSRRLIIREAQAQLPLREFLLILLLHGKQQMLLMAD